MPPCRLHPKLSWSPLEAYYRLYCTKPRKLQRWNNWDILGRFINNNWSTKASTTCILFNSYEKKMAIIDRCSVQHTKRKIQPRLRPAKPAGRVYTCSINKTPPRRSTTSRREVFGRNLCAYEYLHPGVWNGCMVLSGWHEASVVLLAPEAQLL